MLEASIKMYCLIFQMEIDTALSDLEAADFAELVNVYFCCLHFVVCMQ